MEGIAAAGREARGDGESSQGTFDANGEVTLTGKFEPIPGLTVTIEASRV